MGASADSTNQAARRFAVGKFGAVIEWLSGAIVGAWARVRAEKLDGQRQQPCGVMLVSLGHSGLGHRLTSNDNHGPDKQHIPPSQVEVRLGEPNACWSC
jgi:hypothetical protein